MRRVLNYDFQGKVDQLISLKYKAFDNKEISLNNHNLVKHEKK